MEKQAKKLYINVNKETHLNFVLCTIVRPELYSWFYENFINIAIIGDIQNEIEFVDNCGDNSCREVMGERKSYTYDDFPQDEDIIEHLIENIDNDFYSAMWVDKYYMPGNESYMNWHFVHGIMVYGYDDINKTISFVNFSFEKGIILQEISYSDFIAAFINGKTYYKQGGGTATLTETVTNFTVKLEQKNNAFELDRFMSELHDYLYSMVNVAKLRRVDINSNEITYGISAYDKLIGAIDQYTQGSIEQIISFKSFADMCLHKEYMYNRLKYIENNYEVTLECRNKIDEFKKVPKLWNIAKLRSMKYNVMAGTMAAMFSYDSRFISRFTDILKESQSAEKEILKYIYDSLKKYALLKDKMQNIIKKEDYDIKYFENGRARIMFCDPKLIESIEIIDNNALTNNDAIKKVYFSDGSKSEVQGKQYNILRKTRIAFKPKKAEWFEYSESGKNDSDKLRNLDFYIYRPSEKVYWDFNASRYLYCKRKTEADFNKIFANISRVDGQKQNFGFTMIGNDPNISYDVSFDMDKSKYIYIKYKTTCQSENAQLFYATYDYPMLSETQSKVFTISPNDRSLEYIVDMSDDEKWNGVAKQIRFDPVSYDNTSKEGECTIEYIEISDRLPAYGSEKDYARTHGANGWSYHTHNNGTTYREMAWDGQKETWVAFGDGEIMVTPTLQTSKNHMASVRRWICPSEGKYVVKCKYEQKTYGGNASREQLTHFTIRRNHRVTKKNTYDQKSQTLAGDYEAEIALETGESLSFEFYNGNERTTEVMEIEIAIERT